MNQTPNELFIAVPKNDSGLDTPNSAIFGTGKKDKPHNYIEIKCHGQHLTFEPLNTLPELKWKALIKDKDKMLLGKTIVGARIFDSDAVKEFTEFAKKKV